MDMDKEEVMTDAYGDRIQVATCRGATYPTLVRFSDPSDPKREFTMALDAGGVKQLREFLERSMRLAQDDA